MEDQLIIKLFFERSEDAIRELDLKYGKICEYSCAVKPHVRNDGNRQSGTREPLSASLLA